jgi:hypothetical protein
MTHTMMQLMERTDTARLCRGEVIETTESGTVLVALAGPESEGVRCDMLVTTDEAPPPALAPGDTVLVWTSPDGASAVVFGRVGPSRGLTADVTDTPDTLTLEAKRSLTLRVGDGSITIRADGKILIKGKDLVSHAQRTNRIKGGAVAIN